MVSSGSTKDKEIQIEKCITHRSWRNCTAYLEGPHGAVKAECRRRVRGSGAHAYIKVQRWSTLGFPGYSQIGQFIPK